VIYVDLLYFFVFTLRLITQAVNLIGVTDGGYGVPLFLFYSKGKEGKGGEEKLRTPTFRSKVTPMVNLISKCLLIPQSYHKVKIIHINLVYHNQRFQSFRRRGCIRVSALGVAGGLLINTAYFIGSFKSSYNPCFSHKYVELTQICFILLTST
jgi:hypothetical protein